MPAVRRPDRRGEWWVDFRFRGRRVRRRSPIQTRRGAQEFERQLLAQLADDDAHGIDPFAAPPTFAEFAERWMREYVVPRNRPGVHRDKAITLRAHLVPEFGQMLLDGIGPPQIAPFIAKKIAAGLQPKTVNNLLSVLRCCLDTAREWNLLREVPRIAWLRVSTQGYRYLNDNETRELLSAVPSGFWRSLILFLLRTGCRFGEAAALRWEDLELEGPAPFVHLRRSVNRGYVTATKTGRDRIVPLEPDVVCALREFRHTRELVFGRPSDGNYASPASSQKFLTKFCRAAGVKRISWKDLRHTFATALTARGAPIRAVQELLGHTTIQMTSRYAHVAPSTLRACVSLLSVPTMPLVSGSWSPNGHQPTAEHDVSVRQDRTIVAS